MLDIYSKLIFSYIFVRGIYEMLKQKPRYQWKLMVDDVCAVPGTLCW